jgi:hypothetical protein
MLSRLFPLPNKGANQTSSPEKAHKPMANEKDSPHWTTSNFPSPPNFWDSIPAEDWQMSPGLPRGAQQTDFPPDATTKNWPCLQMKPGKNCLPPLLGTSQISKFWPDPPLLNDAPHSA